MVNKDHTQPFLRAGAGEGCSLAGENLPHLGTNDFFVTRLSEGCLALLENATPRV